MINQAIAENNRLIPGRRLPDKLSQARHLALETRYAELRGLAEHMTHLACRVLHMLDDIENALVEYDGSPPAAPIAITPPVDDDIPNPFENDPDDDAPSPTLADVATPDLLRALIHSPCAVKLPIRYYIYSTMRGRDEIYDEIREELQRREIAGETAIPWSRADRLAIEGAA